MRHSARDFSLQAARTPSIPPAARWAARKCQRPSRKTVQLLGPAASAAERAGRVRVVPVTAACSRRVEASRWTDAQWPLAQPLFVALDLVQDPGRGREILYRWTPPEPWRRVK